VTDDPVSPIGQILTVEDIVLDVDVESASGVLRVLASLLAGRSASDAAAIADALAVREKLGSTALGHGTAIPHARLATLSSPSAAFARTLAPIDFGAPDRKPVSLFLGIVVPSHATHLHLRLLAQAAEALSDRSVRDALRRATTAAEVAQLFAAAPVR